LLILGCVFGCAPKEEVLSEIPETATQSGDQSSINAPIRISPSTPKVAPADPLKVETPPIEVNVGKDVDLRTFGLSDYGNKIKSEKSDQSSFTQSGLTQSASLTFATKDAPNKVADFYTNQITSNKSKSVTASTAVIGGLTKTGAKVFVVATKIGDKTQVSINATLTQ